MVVLTCGRAALLERALESLRKGKPVDRESVILETLVIVNGTADPADEHVLEAHRDHIRVIRVSRQRPGGARNHGIDSAKGEWILFLDDDARLPEGGEGMLSQVIDRAIERAAGIVGGPNLTPPDAPRFQRAAGRTLQSRFAAYFSSKRYVGTGTAPWDCGDESLMLCNLLVRRDLLARSGIRFEPSLDCNEENLLIQRLIESGTKAVYDPGFWVFHERRSNLASFCRQVYKYGWGRAQNSILNPRSLHWAHVIPALCLVLAVLLPGAAWITGNPSGCFIPFVVYAAICSALAVRSREPWMLALLPAIHASYALGLIAGFLAYGAPTRYLFDQHRLRQRLGPSGA